MEPSSKGHKALTNTDTAVRRQPGREDELSTSKTNEMLRYGIPVRVVYRENSLLFNNTQKKKTFSYNW